MKTKRPGHRGSKEYYLKKREKRVKIKREKRKSK